MGLNPIQYRPWRGQRTEHDRRFLVIASKVFRQKLGAKWIIGLLIIGTFLTFGIQIIFSSIVPHESLTARTMVGQFQNGLFYIFIIILVSMICSDLVSEDLRSGSLVLYLSRALKPEGYLLGKWLGAVATLSLLTFIAPMILAVTATQSGSDYLSSVAVIGRTVLASAFVTLFVAPIGMMLSSLTTRKTYAAVGTFMVFFLLGLVGGIFSAYDDNWNLLDPGFVLSRSYEVIFGLEMPPGVDGGLLLVAAAMMTVPPTLLVLHRVVRKGVGK